MGTRIPDSVLVVHGRVAKQKVNLYSGFWGAPFYYIGGHSGDLGFKQREGPLSQRYAFSQDRCVTRGDHRGRLSCGSQPPLRT